jgi:hypothetical protein
MQNRVQFYMTDYGPVPLSEDEVANIRYRKNGDFDRRFTASRQLIAKVTAKARADYDRDD